MTSRFPYFPFWQQNESSGSSEDAKGHRHSRRNPRQLDSENQMRFIGPVPSSSTSGKSVIVGGHNSGQREKRARIDNLGAYHEYPPQLFRAIKEEVVMRTLNETNEVASGNATAEQSAMFLPEFPGPITITALMATSHIFIRPCKRSSVPTEVKGVKGSGICEVLNDENRRIFFVKQTRRTSCLSYIFLWGFLLQNFEFTVLDRNGKAALKVNGRQVLFGVHNKATFHYADGTFLAKMRQSLCEGFYRIYDDKSKVIFTVVGPVFSCYAPCVLWCCDEEFEILFSGSADEVGRIGKYWEESEFPSTKDCIGASYPRSMSLRSKSVIFGACLTIVMLTLLYLKDGIHVGKLKELLLSTALPVLCKWRKWDRLASYLSRFACCGGYHTLLQLLLSLSYSLE